MSIPTIREIIKFVLHHDQWVEEQEAIEFCQMVEALTRHHYIKDIPRIKWLIEHSDEMLQKLRKARYNWRVWVLIELDIEHLIQINDARRIVIPENPFGRFIPVHELFDHAIRRRGKVESIDVSFGGMVVTTDCGHTVRLPGCEIYLGRLDEDGLRYRNTAILIEHVTGGGVQLDWKELTGHTDHIVVERDGDGWKVDTGLSVPA